MGKRFKIKSAVRWRIGLYLRLSKEDKAKLAGAIHSDSIENQDKILADFINELRQRYPEEIFEVVGIYIDEGLTGTNTDKRDQFNLMVDNILKGEINCVLFKDLSRMFRNHTEQSHFLELFCPEYEIRVISINNNIDTYFNPEVVYGYDVTLTGVSNDRYCYTISNNIKRTFDMKKKRGEFIGPFAPYGLRKDPENRNKLLIDEEAAEVIVQIFDWYKSGQYSKNEIARQLNDSGVPSPIEYKRQKGSKYKNPIKKHSAGNWTARTISDILENQMYLGHMVQNKSSKVSYKIDKIKKNDPEDWIIVKNTHEAIIDEETFERVQQLLKLNTKSTKAVSNSRKSDGNNSSEDDLPNGGNDLLTKKGDINIFSGLIFCGECGRSMHRKKNKDSNHALYRCCSYMRISENFCSVRGSIREPILINAVLKAIQSQIMFIEDIDKIIEEIENSPVVKKESNRLNMQYKKAKEELFNKKKIQDDLYYDYKEKLISREQLIRLKEECTLDIEKQEKILKNLKQQIIDLETGVDKENVFLTMFKKNKNVTELDRLLIVELVEKIIIHKDKTVEIVFKFQDQLQRVIDYVENGKNDFEIVI